MTMRDRIKALEFENAALKAQVALLSAHVCPPAVPQCTCGYQSVAGTTWQPCPVHSWPANTIWRSPTNVCAGAYGPPITIYNTAAAGPITYVDVLPAAAGGCAAPLPAYFVSAP